MKSLPWAIVGLTLVLTGCSYISKPSFIHNRDDEYLSAKSIPPLKIPPGIASSTFKNLYPIPERSYSDAAKQVSLIPPGLNGG